jgi:hypothetical protein
VGNRHRYHARILYRHVNEAVEMKDEYDILIEARKIQQERVDPPVSNLLASLIYEIELLRARAAVLQRKSDDIDEDNILWGPR